MRPVFTPATAVFLMFGCAGWLFAAPNSDSVNQDDLYWHSLTVTDSSLSSFVNAMLVFRGELIVAGGFASAGAVPLYSIARWDGSGWRPLGKGMDAPVSCLAEYRGELIAAGEFKTAGGMPASRIARWNGSTWKPLDAGIAGQTPSTWACVTAMTQYNGELIVGGHFSKAGGSNILSLARWNGSSWRSLPYQLTGDVKALTTFHNQLIVAGDISEPNSGTPVMRWDGDKHWTLVGNGAPDDAPVVFGLYHQNLAIGGKFSELGDVEAVGVAELRDSVWHPLANGLGRNIWALAEYNGELIAAGADGGIASWDGTVWRPLGSGANGDINALLVFNGKLIVAGGFTEVGGNAVKFVAIWDKPNTAISSEDR